MIALKIFPILQVLLILFTDPIFSYPSSVYNSKHFRQPSHRPVYDPYTYTRNLRYYEYYPSYQMYPDEYYYTPQDAYPLYYITPRTSKYDYYQTSLPYYQQDVPVTRNKYYNYNYGDDPDKMLQDIEREQRERSQPIGHEIKYEGDYNSDDEGALDETSAAFLNNLMMQQMYQDNLRSPKTGNYYDQYPDYSYNSNTNEDTNEEIKVNKWNDVPYDRPVNFEDEEVKELKELPKKQKEGRKNRQRKQRKLKNNEKRSGDDAVVFTDRKPVVKDVSPTSLPAEEPRRNTRGQKEVVMLRPATPVRHPFSDSVLDMLSQQDQERKRSPSVYDKIRHLLEMEKNEENSEDAKPEDEVVRPSMKKRIVSSEDTLTRELTGLKRVQ